VGRMLASEITTRHSLCRQVFQTSGLVSFQQKWKRPDGGDTYEPVLFQFVPCTFYIHILLGRKIRADPIICRGTSLDVPAELSLISAFQVPADWAIHIHALPAFCRANRSWDAVAAQKMPAISIEVRRERS
jgi:hypothetical protein